MRLTEAVEAALGAVEATGDTADVALRLARQVEVSATPSAVRELRYALYALGVRDLEPYGRLMEATKVAIDRGDSLPSLATQLRETEQLVRRLSDEPVNAPMAQSVRQAVDDLEGLWAEAWADHVAGREHDWDRHRERSRAAWRVIDAADADAMFPGEVERALAAFHGYWQGRRVSRGRAAGLRVRVR